MCMYTAEYYKCIQQVLCGPTLYMIVRFLTPSFFIIGRTLDNEQLKKLKKNDR